MVSKRDRVIEKVANELRMSGGTVRLVLDTYNAEMRKDRTPSEKKTTKKTSKKK